MKNIILFLITLTLGNLYLIAQTVTLKLKGNVTFLLDPYKYLKDSIKINDSISASIIYYTNIADNNSDITVGDYYNTKPPAGITVKINSFKFYTDSNQINLLAEVVYRPSNNSGSAIVFHSYKNNLPYLHISWQLDDPFGTVFSNDSLFTHIDLNKFEQIFGLTIHNDDIDNPKLFMIRGIIKEVISIVKDSNNLVIKTDTSEISLPDTTINIDTTLAGLYDFDGNLYKTVKIGNQIWMRENFRGKHYANGVPIPDVTVYNNDENNAKIYGRLYSWYAVMNGANSSISLPSGVKGVCPCGWHVPSDKEWLLLIKYLGGSSIAGSKLKETGTSHWIPPNEYATNTSLFNALPGGNYRSCKFFDLGNTAFFWSTSEYFYSSARSMILNQYSPTANVFNGGYKTEGYSVRCIKNDELPISINYAQKNQLMVYPNPATQFLYIMGLSTNKFLQIFDMNGKLVKTAIVTKNIIDIQSLKNGIYLIKLIYKNNTTLQKFVKQ